MSNWGNALQEINMANYNRLSNNYKNKLMHLIINYSYKKRPNFKNFITVFSYLIYLNDESYKYNVPYLPEQYEKFKSFIKKAHEKRLMLKNVAERIKHEKEILDFLNNDKKIIISINDFLEFECSKKSISEEIRFCGEPSINRAKIDKKDSIFTVKYYDNNNSLKELKTYQYQLFADEVKEIEENNISLIKIVKNILGMDENG